jgi:hypothetical protein
MAAPTLTFTSEYSTTDKSKLILVDTTDYGLTPITNRQWVIQKADGTTSKIDASVLIGNTITFTLDKDYALIIRLQVNFNPAIEYSGLSKTKNILAANNLSSALYDIRKDFVNQYWVKKDNKLELEELLSNVELADSFYDSAVNLVSTDIKAAQDALDLGNAQAILCNC